MSTLRVPVTDRDHILGPPRAELTMVEYGDYQCPYCRAASVVVRDVKHRFGAALRFVFRHFPLTEIHPLALTAAEAAEAAGVQGKFWEMHETLYANQDALTVPDLLAYAGELDLDVERMAEELSSHIHVPRIREDFAGGVRSGVNGTPCFFINGERHDGSWDARTLTAALEKARIKHVPVASR
jgi:protein-disulfide isomerase